MNSWWTKSFFFDNPLVPDVWGQDNGRSCALPKGAQQKLCLIFSMQISLPPSKSHITITLLIQRVMFVYIHRWTLSEHPVLLQSNLGWGRRRRRRKRYKRKSLQLFIASSFCWAPFWIGNDLPLSCPQAFGTSGLSKEKKLNFNIFRKST